MTAPDPFSDLDLSVVGAVLRGSVIEPGDPEYDSVRTTWNARFDHRPGAVVRCLGTADVMAAVDFGRRHGLPLAVRGTGHDYAGRSVPPEGLMLDLSPMDGIQVNPATRTARVRPGVRWRAFDHEAQAFGLATTGCTVSTVGVGGYTLGGGSGYLARKHGLATDNLVGAEVVTAAGERVWADDRENADLFWALRGGGGNLGVVTSFEYALHPVGPEVLAGQIIHPLGAAKEALALYRGFMAEAADEITVYPFFLNLPPLEAIPGELHGKPGLVLVMVYAGDPSRGEEALRPLTQFGDPLLSAVQPMPYTAAQQMFDEGMPGGRRRYSRAQYVDEISDDAIDTLVEWVAGLQGPLSAAYLEPMGGAVNRVDPGETAFPHRSAAYGFHVLTGWTEPADDRRIMEWTDDFHDAMTPYAAGGVYVNLLSEDEGGRIREAYGDNYPRLAAIKGMWDPDNLFRHNQNVQPAG